MEDRADAAPKEAVTEAEARASSLALIPADVEPASLSGPEQYVAAAADLLRGSIDQADCEQFIFPLLSLERTCDVYLEK